MWDAARRLGTREAFWAAAGVSHPPTATTANRAATIRCMASAGAKGVPRVRHVALKPHHDWAHGHSTPTGRVSRMPAFVAPARQLRCILERDLAPITGFRGEHAMLWTDHLPNWDSTWHACSG